jgi:hypothetical protein
MIKKQTIAELLGLEIKIPKQCKGGKQKDPSNYNEKGRYIGSEEARKKDRERRKKRWDTDPNFRRRCQEANKKRYQKAKQNLFKSIK